MAQESILGYLLSGTLSHLLSQAATFILLQLAFTVVPEVPNVENSRSIKSVGTDTIKQTVDSTFLHTYQQSSITQAPEVMYIAKFHGKRINLSYPQTLLFARNELHYCRNFSKHQISSTSMTTLSRIRRSKALLKESMMMTLLRTLIIFHIVQSRKTLPQHQFELSMTVAVAAMVCQPVSMIV